jgi:hypothetical protein
MIRISTLGTIQTNGSPWKARDAYTFDLCCGDV